MSRSDPIVEVEALREAAGRALAAGQPESARRFLEQALLARRDDPVLLLNLAAVCRAGGDFEAALRHIEAALVQAPRAFHALLMKGSVQERLGRSREAAASYGAALNQAPPEATLDPHTRAALAQARTVHRRHVEALERLIRSRLGAGAVASDSAEARRAGLFIDATLGRRRIFRQEPTHYHYPGLPAIEFYERSEFPWLGALEAATGAIRSELEQALRQPQELQPYIDYPDSAPMDQWRELNRSQRWSAYHFFHRGQRDEAHCQACPETLAALALLDQPLATGCMPAAMFSVLQPGTRIPPHVGVANVRLVVHLALMVPPGCGFRVGNERREWVEGRAWVFDDTIEHEAWNLGDQPRAVLIADVWNPRLGSEERSMIAAIMSAMDEFNGAAADWAL